MDDSPNSPNFPAIWYFETLKRLYSLIPYWYNVTVEAIYMYPKPVLLLNATIHLMAHPHL